MAMFNYESEELYQMARGETNHSSPVYVADCKKEILTEVTPNYPKLTDYEKEWMYFAKNNYVEGTPVPLEYLEIQTYDHATVENVIPFVYKSATLKGDTKYRDIDTGDILDTFDETKNLELVSVKVPVLTTSNGEGTKTDILTVNEDVELHGVGEVKDELDLLTGELTQRIGEVVLDGSEDWVQSSHEDSSMFYISFNNLVHKGYYVNSIICDKLVVYDNESYLFNSTTPNGISAYADWSDAYPNENWIYIKCTDSEGYVEKLKQWLSHNPITVQYELATESVKTVDLSTTIRPYEGTNHYTVSSDTIPPQLILVVPIESTGNKTLNDINTEE